MHVCNLIGSLILTYMYCRPPWSYIGLCIWVLCWAGRKPWPGAARRSVVALQGMPLQIGTEYMHMVIRFLSLSGYVFAGDINMLQSSERIYSSMVTQLVTFGLCI
jgi:hypothetical protein